MPHTYHISIFCVHQELGRDGEKLLQWANDGQWNILCFLPRKFHFVPASCYYHCRATNRFGRGQVSGVQLPVSHLKQAERAVGVGGRGGGAQSGDNTTVNMKVPSRCCQLPERLVSPLVLRTDSHTPSDAKRGEEITRWAIRICRLTRRVIQMKEETFDLRMNPI